MQGEEHIHVVGAAGCGMSALSSLLLQQGVTLSGSDRDRDADRPAEVLERLAAAGMDLFPQDGSGVHSGLDAVVASTAVELDNPDLAAATALGLPIKRRGALLAERLVEGRTLAVGGTAGKTTITGMLGWLLAECGRDPTVVNGGVLPAWVGPAQPGSVRLGHEPEGLNVVEADESDGSHLLLNATWALIANVGLDHFSLDEIKRSFCAFATQAVEGVWCGPGVADQLGLVGGKVHTVSYTPCSGGFVAEDGHRYMVPLLGAHNVQNAALAIAMCRHLGVAAPALEEALMRFTGVARRLERVGSLMGCPIYDDYAHNPMKISASWRAVAETSDRVLGVWRPHGFAPLDNFFDALVEAFVSVVQPDDCVYVLPVYYVGGTARRGRTHADLVRALQQRGCRAEACSGYDEVQRHIQQCRRQGDAILVMGARDPELPLFARRLKKVR